MFACTMSEIGKAVSTSSISDNNRFNLNIGEQLHLQTQVESHVEPYELVELFYESNGVATNQINHVSADSLHQSLPQVIEDQQKKRKATITTYKCEICGRVFKEASHFSKHKRGALCRKSAKKLAKKHKYFKEKETNDRKSKTSNLYKPYQCTLCGSKFLDKVNVELHLERTHQTRQSLWLQTSKTGGIACTECDLWFVDKSQLKHHQQQHNNISNHISTLHTSQIEPPNLQPPFVQQPMPPPPPPPPQYYFQPLQHIQTFNQIHQLGPPVPPPPPQGIQQLSPQMPPPQGHPLTTFLVSHHQNPQQNGSALPHSPSPNQHQSISHAINASHIPLSTPPPPPPPPAPPPPQPSTPPTHTCTQTSDSTNSVKCTKTSFSSNWTASRKNICGECGLKFVDPINLELHLQRKHPNSNITETVGLEGGLTLYKTNNNNNNNNNNNGTVESQVPSCSSKYFVSQSFECILCGFKASHMNNIVNHLQSSHNTNNANFINVTLLSGTDAKVHSTNHSTQRDSFNFSFPDGSLKCKCDSCSKEFVSQADLVRHTINEKNIFCGNCSYNSCSDTKVAFHMFSSHKECNQSSIKNTSRHKDLTAMHDSPNSSCHVEESSGSESLTESACSLSKLTSEDKLTCCLCNFNALTGASLAQHLESHGSIDVKCEKCSESIDHFIKINTHINAAHEGEITLISITMTGSESPTVYMFMIMPNQNCVPNGLYDDQDSSKECDSRLQTSKGVTNEDDFNGDDDEIYACSDCMISLKGSSQLEAHIRSHPSFISKEISHPTTDCSGESYLLSIEETFSSSSVFPQKFDPLLQSLQTIEFRCKECGFWRRTSGPVLRHIKAVHLSGHIIHSWKLKTGRIDCITIQVFTPLSHLVRS